MSCQTHRLGCNHLQALHQLQRGDGAAAGAVHMLANVLGDQQALGFVRHFTGAKALAGLADRHLAQLDAATAWALAVAPPQQHVGQLGAGILDALRQHPGHEAGVRVQQAAVLRQAAQDLHAALHLSPALGNVGANHVESAPALARQLLGHALQLLLGHPLHVGLYSVGAGGSFLGLRHGEKWRKLGANVVQTCISAANAAF